MNTVKVTGDRNLNTFLREGLKGRFQVKINNIKPDFEIIYFSLNDMDSLVKLLQESEAEFKIVWHDGKESIEAFQTAFQYNAFRYIPKRQLSYKNLARRIIKEIEEIHSLKLIVGEVDGKSTPLRNLLSQFGNSYGVQVLDKSFRVWYRNDKHKKIVGTQAQSALCWVTAHKYTDTLVPPCVVCHVRDFFEKKITDKKPIRYSAVGCARNSREPLRLTEIQTLPLYTEDNKLIGCVELLEDITDNTKNKPIEEINKIIGSMLRVSFLGGRRYDRVRLFRYSEGGQVLRCVNWEGEPGPKEINMEDIIIPIGEDNQIDVVLPEYPRPRDINSLSNSEIYLFGPLQKEEFPWWVDFPLKCSDGRFIGKVVVDRHKDGGSIDKKEITGYDHVLEKCIELLDTSQAYENQMDLENVKSAMDSMLSLVTKPLFLENKRRENIKTENEIYKQLVSHVCKLSGVVSALVRVPYKKGNKIYLRKVHGHGVYGKYCQECIPLSEETLSGTAYLNRAPSKVAFTKRKGNNEFSPLRFKRNIRLNKAEKKEKSRIHYQQSYPIGAQQMAPSATLSVQLEDQRAISGDSNTISMLAIAASAPLAIRAIKFSSVDLRKCLLSVLRLHDVETAEHSERVGKIARIIAKKIEGLDQEQAYLAGCLHDIGKVGLANSLIRGNNRLTEGEWFYLRAHVDLGKDILDRIPGLHPIRDAVMYHHQWFNGKKGYPIKPKRKSQKAWEDEQSVLGQVLALADSYEAMTSPARHYQEPLSPTEGRSEVEKFEGKQFAPQAVKAFLDVLADIERELFPESGRKD